MAASQSVPAKDVLGSYLPPSLLQRWQSGEDLDLASTVKHLTSLLTTVATYVPRAVIDGKLWGQAGTGGYHHGTFIFADVSGFTPMSERFSRSEEERGSGSEELTGVVNSYFQVVNGIALFHGGDLLKFGGDAVLGLFMGENHAARACRAALEMQAAMAESFALIQTSLGSFPLRMNIGLGTGPFFSVSVGNPDRLEYAILGPAVQSMAQAEGLARAGQVALDQRTREEAGSAVIVYPEPLGEGYFELQHAVSLGGELFGSGLVIPEGPSEEVVSWLVDRLNTLTPYLPLGLLDKLRSAPSEFGIESDHRFATVFFAGLHGTSQLMEALGPERVADGAWALNRTFVALQEVIERYEGVVNRVGAGKTGLQLHVLFGAPLTHEDDPERAVFATMDMQQALHAVNREVVERLGLEAAPFHQSIGVTTGFVFAGSIGSAERREYTVMGDVVNLAHRLMTAAPQGETYISAATKDHLSERIMAEEKPPIEVKGKSAPVRHFSVRGTAEAASLRGREYRQLVGRRAELARAESAFDDVHNRNGRLLVISGDVGVGKTRLALELMHRSGERGMTTVFGQSVSFLRDTVPYLPWTEVLRSMLNVVPGSSSDEQLAVVTAGLAQAGLDGWEPLVAEILGLPVEETSLTSPLDPRMRQQRLFDLVLELIAHQTRERTLLLWLEDLQWADVASLGLLDYVARNIRRLPIMLMLTVRPVEHLEGRWRELPHFVEMQMGELDEAERAQMVAQLLQVPQVQDSVLQGIVARAQGNPLFIEETVRAFTDAGVLVREGAAWTLATDPDSADVPDTVHGILQSRLDRLPETNRRILQVASVIGQSFATRVLARVYPYGDLNGNLPMWLEALTSREFLVPAAPPSDYAFRHAMIQDVAYTSLPHARRRALHRDIAYMFEGSGYEEVPERFEFVALHFYRGRVWDKALPYLLQAGEKTRREYANESAIAHFRRALRAISELPDSSVGHQLEAYVGLGQVLTLLGRYDEALESLEDGWDLVEGQPGSTDRDVRLAQLCRRMAEVYDPKGDYAAAFEWLERGLAIPGVEDTIEGAQLRRTGAAVLYRQGENSLAGEWCTVSLDIAERLGDEEVLAQGNYSMGAILVRQGDFAGAVEHCRRSVSLYEKLGNLLGQSQAYNNLALAYDMQGDWGGAVRYYRAASDILERIGYAEGQAMTATNLGEILLLQGELDAAIEQYRQALGIVERLGHPYGMALLNMNLGAVYARGDRWDEASDHLERSSELFREIGSEEFLAELYRHQSVVALGRGEVDRALEHAQRSLDHVQAQAVELEEGPTRRVLGRAWLHTGEADRAKKEFERALALALEMENRYETGRAQLELGRLCLRQGQLEEGAELVRQAAKLFRELGARLDLREAEDVFPIGSNDPPW